MIAKALAFAVGLTVLQVAPTAPVAVPVMAALWALLVSDIVALYRPPAS